MSELLSSSGAKSRTSGKFFQISLTGWTPTFSFSSTVPSPLSFVPSSPNSSFPFLSPWKSSSSLKSHNIRLTPTLSFSSMVPSPLSFVPSSPTSSFPFLSPWKSSSSLKSHNIRLTPTLSFSSTVPSPLSFVPSSPTSSFPFLSPWKSSSSLKSHNIRLTPTLSFSSTVPSPLSFVPSSPTSSFPFLSPWKSSSSLKSHNIRLLLRDFSLLLPTLTVLSSSSFPSSKPSPAGRAGISLWMSSALRKALISPSYPSPIPSQDDSISKNSRMDTNCSVFTDGPISLCGVCAVCQRTHLLRLSVYL